MRALVVPTAYLIAVAIGLLAYGIVGQAWTGLEFSRLFKFVIVMMPTFFFVLVVNYWLTPFVIAGLAASEFLKAKHWIFYLAGGAALGIVICAQRLPYEVERPPFGEMLPYYSSVMAGSLLAGAVYWFIAWRKWPPATIKDIHA
ncbi:MAG: hypothetical protein AAFY07_01915 [Pseudomonadota bacterium]